MTSSVPGPTFAELLDWLEGRLEGADADKIAQRVAEGDSASQRTVAWIQSFLASSPSQALEQPPAIIRQRLRQSFQRYHNGSGEIERMVASLAFDSRVDPNLSGVRAAPSGSIDRGYQLAYRVAEFDVLLDVTSSSAGSRFDGQVFCRREAAPVWQVTAEFGSGRIVDINGDDLSCFVLEQVPADASRLVLTNGETEICLPLTTDPGS